jgi:hypothetical protein
MKNTIRDGPITFPLYFCDGVFVTNISKPEKDLQVLTLKMDNPVRFNGQTVDTIILKLDDRQYKTFKERFKQSLNHGLRYFVRQNLAIRKLLAFWCGTWLNV